MCDCCARFFCKMGGEETPRPLLLKNARVAKPDLWGPVSGGLGSGDYRWGRGTGGGVEGSQAESSGGHTATKLISKPPPCPGRDHGERREGCQNLLTSAGHMTTGGPAAADSILGRWGPSQEHTLLSHRYPDSDLLAGVDAARSLVVPCLTACFFSSNSSVPVVWATLLAPLGAYHRVFQNVCVRLEPALQWLDFSVRGYMMSNPIDNQCK